MFSEIQKIQLVHSFELMLTNDILEGIGGRAINLTIKSQLRYSQFKALLVGLGSNARTINFNISIIDSIYDFGDIINYLKTPRQLAKLQLIENNLTMSKKTKIKIFKLILAKQKKIIKFSIQQT